MAGKIIADTLEHSTAGSVTTDYVVNGSVKSWANINQDTSGHPTRDSLNVSSTLDAGAGSTRFTVTSAMNNENYAVLATCTVDTSYNQNSCAQEVTTTTYDLYNDNGSATSTDNPYGQVAVLGDLA